MEKATVTKVTGSGTFNSQYGLLYKWEIELSNGLTGNTNTKDLNQEKWVVGKEVWYSVTEKNGFKNFKAEKAPDQPFNNPGSPTPKNESVQRTIIMQNCIGNSVNYLVGMKAAYDEKQIFRIANLMFDAVIEKGVING